MIFNDVESNYNELREKVEGLETFKAQLKVIVTHYMDFSSNLINLNINSQVNGSNIGSIAKDSIARLVNIQTLLRKISLKDVWKTFYKLESFKDFGFEMYKPVLKLLNSLENCCELLFEFTNTPLDNSVAKKLVILISVINTTIIEIDGFYLIASCLKNINYELQNNIIYTEGSTITIRIYRDDMTVREIGNYMVSINDIYERVCAIVGVSATEYALRPIKIESGSWYEKLFGHPSVIKFMQELLNRAIGFVYRNYTNEGKLAATPYKMELLEKELNIIQICEEHGINVESSKKIVEENITLICKDLLTLTAKNTKIAVNERVFELGQEVAASLIEGCENKLLGTEEELDDLLPQTGKQ